MLVFLASANAKVLLFALPDAKVPDGRELQSPTISNSTGRHQPFIDIKHHDPLYYSKYIKNINDYEYREMATAIGLSALSEQWRLLTSLIKV